MARASYIGQTAPGPARTDQSSERLRLGLFAMVDLDPTTYFNAVTAYLDGLGAGSGDQVVRPVVFSAAGALVASGPTVTVANDQEAAWVTMPLDLGEPVGEETSWLIGLHFDTTANVARLYEFPNTTTGRYRAGVSFAAGAPATTGALTTTVEPSVFAGLSNAAVPTSEAIADDELARLGYYSAQERLVGAPTAKETNYVSCEWHGTRTDPERGAFAIVRSDGPLADYVGERLMVSNEDTNHSVNVYCHAEGELDSDISLTRRAFMAIAALATEELSVIVEVLG